MFDVRRAQALWAVAQYGSITAAAEVLHVTSSALSQQLAKLEREVGQPLLVRRGRGVALTDAGRLLVGHTGDILDRMAVAEADLEASRGVATGRMAIAVFATFNRTVLPRALTELRRDYPRLAVESHECEPTAAIAMLARGEVDVAVIDEWFHSEPTLSEGLRHRLLGTDTADLAIPVGHPLAELANPVDLAGCTSYEWVSWAAGEHGSLWLQAALAATAGQPTIRHTAREHQSILALVAAGLGIALMPRLGRESVPDRVVIKSVSPPITRRYFAVWRVLDNNRPALTAALDALVG